MVGQNLITSTPTLVSTTLSELIKSEQSAIALEEVRIARISTKGNGWSESYNIKISSACFLRLGTFWKGANGKKLETKCQEQNFDITPQSFVMVMGVIPPIPPTSDNPAPDPRWKDCVVSSAVRSLKTKLPYTPFPHYGVTMLLACYITCLLYTSPSPRD